MAASPMPQALEEVHDLIRAAVVHRRPVAAVYDGRQRLLCPHVLGWNKEGRRQALCYQYGGESKSGLRSESGSGQWRCLALDKFGRVELLDGPWRTEARSGPQTCVERIEVAAAAPDQPEREPQ